MRHLIEIIESARSNFVKADWRHEFRGDSDEVDVSYCEGDVDGCQYCVDVRKSAKAADKEAEEAIEALMSGDIVGACDHLEFARRIELEWGDAPAYGPALQALESAAAV